jgi:hypothetical protein
MEGRKEGKKERKEREREIRGKNKEECSMVLTGTVYDTVWYGILS